MKDIHIALAGRESMPHKIATKIKALTTNDTFLTFSLSFTNAVGTNSRPTVTPT